MSIDDNVLLAILAVVVGICWIAEKYFESRISRVQPDDEEDETELSEVKKP